MTKLFKLKIIYFSFVALTLFLLPSRALAYDPGGGPGGTPGGSPGGGSCISGSVASFKDLECMFNNKILPTLIPIAGIIFFFMFLMGGFKYITSAGDPKSLASANQTITYAVIGLIACALSYVVLLLIYYLTGNSAILNFTIIQP